ncbi:hypothetical protein AVEN_177941-1, partial [Araneus ventricosus]
GSPSLGGYWCPNPEVPRDLYSLPVYSPLSLLLFAKLQSPDGKRGSLHDELF